MPGGSLAAQLNRSANFFPHSFWEWLLVIVIVLFIIWAGRQLFLDHEPPQNK